MFKGFNSKIQISQESMASPYDLVVIFLHGNNYIYRIVNLSVGLPCYRHNIRHKSRI